jgi:hypothetical protein
MILGATGAGSELRSNQARIQPKRRIPSAQYVPVPARHRGGQQNQ